MKFSTTLLSTISKTKKRLSDGQWYVPINVLLVLGLATILSYGMRTISLTWEFGVIRSSIPVMSEVIDHKNQNRESKNDSNIASIKSTTPLIVLADDAFFIGDVEAFTTSFVKIRNKIRIPHLEGSPQLGDLVDVLKSRQEKLNLKEEEIALLLPGEQWPMAVVLQVMQLLKSKGTYKHVILASELM